MKQLKVEIYNNNGKKLETIIIEKNVIIITYLSRKAIHSDIINWINDIDHWTVKEENIIIYFNNNYYIKLNRI